MSKKTKTKSEPWAPAQPYILDNLAQTKATFDANQPGLQAAATQQQGTYGRLAPGAEAGITGAQGLVNSNLSGANLNGNPYLEGIISKSNRDITDGVNGQFSLAGRYGSGSHAGILTDKLAENENALRYGNYATERGYQQSAIGDAQNLMGGATGLLNNAAQLPWIGVQAQNGGTNSLSNGYGTTTSKTKDPMGTLTSLAGAAATAYASDERVKDVREQVGTTPQGLPLYRYTYKGDNTPQVGVMAQDVAQVKPDALGPTGPGGMMSVDYSKLGLPDPSTMAEITPQVNAGTDLRSGHQQWADNLINPDTSTTRGKIGLLGHYLLAAGAPTAGLGQGLLAMRKDGQDQARYASEHAGDADLRTAQAEYYRSRANKVDAPAPPRILQFRDGSAVSIDANGNQTELHGPIAGPERLVQTAGPNGPVYTPSSKAAGMPAYVKPAAAPRAAAASKSPPKYAMGPNGKLMKWVP